MIVSETQPPPLDCSGDFWERGLEPFHQDAMPEGFKHIGTPGVRKTGWNLLDWWGNVIGWTADGTKIEEDE